MKYTLRLLRLASLVAIAAGCSQDDGDERARSHRSVGRTVQAITAKSSTDPLGRVKVDRRAAGQAIQNRVLFKLRSNVPPNGQGTSVNQAPRALPNGVSNVRELMKPASAGRAAAPLAQGGSFGAGVYAGNVAVPQGKTIEAVANEIAAQPGVEWCEPDRLISVHATPNDPEFWSQPHLTQVHADSAWDTTRGSKNVVVAVLDTGVDYSHPDLSENIWSNVDEVPGNGLDDDGNGYIDDTRGWDFVTIDASQVASGEDAGPPDNNPADFNGHGTHVAGIIGARGNNGLGVSGVNWNVSLMPLRAGYQDPSGNGLLEISAIVEALNYAANNGARVVNMSFGSPEPSVAMREAIAYATSRGVLLVASAGNSNTNAPSYPAAFEQVVAVSATRGDSRRAGYSNFGSWVSIAAPGSDILSTGIAGSYVRLSGTSMAGPVVAGAAALVFAAHPDWTPEVVKQQLLATADAIDGGNPAYAGLLGAGRVNAARAIGARSLSENIRAVDVAYRELQGDFDGEFEAQERILVQVSAENFGSEAFVRGELVSNSPFVTVAVGAVDFGSVRFRRTVMQNFEINVASNVPSNHNASLALRLISASGSVERALELPLSPTFRAPLRVARGQVFDHVVRELPDGTAAIITAQHLQTGFGLMPGAIVATLRSPDGTIASAPINDTSSSASGPDSFVTPTGDIHVVYQRNVGPWNNQLFYVKYNAATRSWSSEEQVTTDAVIFGIGWTGDQELVVDSAGVVHLVWSDIRNAGERQIFYARRTTSGWTAGAPILTLPSDTIGIGLDLQQLPDDRRFLFYDRGIEASLPERGVLHGSGMTWSTHHTHPNLFDQHRPIVHGSEIYRLYKDFDWFEPHKLARYTGSGFSYVRDVIENQTGQWSDSSVMISAAITEENRFAMAVAEQNFDTYGYDIHHRLETESGFTREPMRKSRFAHWYPSFTQKATTSAAHTVAMLHYPEAVWESDTSVVTMLRSEGLAYLTNAALNPNQLPTTPAVTAAFEGSTDFIRVEANSSHASGIAHYEFAIGPAPGNDDFVSWTRVTAMPTWRSLPEAMRPGQPYYVSVRAAANALYESQIGVSQALCIPDCNGRACGSDGCGGVCGTCENGAQCGANGQCGTSSKECTATRLNVASVRASSVEDPGFEPALAIDGSMTTRWSSQFANPQWIELDLGARRHVDRLVLHWEAAASANYEIQVSDNQSSWTSVRHETTADGGVDDLGGLQASGRYIRIYSHTRTTPYGNSLFEIEVYGDVNPDCDDAVCVPSCSGKQCGDDGCGGSCGTCAAGESCDGAGQCQSSNTTCDETRLGVAAAVASSVEASGYEAGKAIDNDLSTRWSSVFSDPQWLELDLGAKRYINRVVLHWETAASANYAIQVSDDRETWTTVRGDANGDGGVDELQNLTARGRYLRVYSFARATEWGNSLFEVELYGDLNADCGGCTNNCGPTCRLDALDRVAATASSVEEAAYTANFAIDGNAQTRWSSLFADPQWITIDLGQARYIARVVLSWEAAASANYAVQISKDGTNFVTVRNVPNGDGGVDELNALNTVGRYLRIYSHARLTPWGNSLWEVDVYGDTLTTCTP